MKTTIEISDPVLREARKLAAREGTTLRALVEQGLRYVVEERKPKRKPGAKMPDASVGGRGLRPELKDAGWEKIRALIYEGRGG
jgi:hypothetical protein